MKNLGIIYGGRSTEHDASLKSKDNFYNNLDREKFNVVELIFIDRDGSIYLNNSLISLGELIDKMKVNKDIFYLNLLHGQEGEDGSWSGIFDICDINGSFETVNTSSVLMNKFQQSAVVAYSFPNLLIPKTQLIKRDDIDNLDFIINNLECENIIIKPNTMGASHFVKKIKKTDIFEIKETLQKIFEFDREIIIQEFIQGEEYTCGVIKYENDTKSLPIIHVKSNFEFLDHVSKHSHGNTKCDFEYFEKSELLHDLSKQLFKMFNIIGMCRFDYLITDLGEIYYLEGNLIPGFSNGSAFPMMLKEENISLTDFTINFLKAYENSKGINKYLPYNID